MKPMQRTRGFRLVAVIRVLALALACSAAGLVLLFQVSRARAGDVLTELGAQLMQLEGARYRNGVQRLTINGMTLLAQSGSSRKGPQEVVDQFYAACKQRTGLVLDERQAAQLEPVVAPSGFLRDALDGVVVQRGRKDSAIACIESGEQRWDVMGLVEAASRLVESGDLLELGRLRYALVRPDAEGGSVFLTMWTDGHAHLLGLFPAEGDAPGVDFPDLKRVAGGRRFLSTQLGASLMVVYRHDGPLEPVTNKYRAALRAAGYRRVGTPGKGDALYAFSYERGGRHVVLTVKGGNEGPVMATLVTQP